MTEGLATFDLLHLFKDAVLIIIFMEFKMSCEPEALGLAKVGGWISGAFTWISKGWLFTYSK